jgi:uncharacterized sulfatase
MTEQRPPRQVVIIMTDTQRKDMLGCYGNPDMKTPHLDRLASEGIRFERAYTCQPVCGPARSALFTGTFPHSNGTWANSLPLGDTVKTVGQRLQDRGIKTAYVGKWHLDGGDYFGMGRCPPGWDPEYWYDMRNYLDELPLEDRQESRSLWKSQDPDLTADFTYGHRVSNRALQFLEKHAHEDFLLVVSYDEPHGPFVAPRPYADMYQNYNFPVSENVKDTLNDKPEHQQAWAGALRNGDRTRVKIQFPAFFGCNSFVDAEIGRVLEKIDAYAPNSLVVYTADHGDMLGSHCLNNKGPAMYEEITNIPFLVRWKGRVQEKQISSQLVSHIDVVPTILDVFQIPESKVLEGNSMLPLFSQPDQPFNNQIYIEFGRYEVDHDGFGGFQPIRCVCDGRYKLVINLLATDELYDLQQDPGEIINLISSQDSEIQAVRNGLHDKLLEWMNATRDPFRGYYWERRPWRLDARPASWSYTGFTRQREEDECYEPKQLDYSTGLPIQKAHRKK